MYHKYAQELINKKLAYWSYLTPIDKEDLQNLKKVTKKPIDYYLENILRHPKFAKSKKNPETLKKEAENEVEYLFANVEKILTSKQKPALMYRLQRAENFECFDELLGQTSFDLSLEEDFVILKSDGYPTYHLAHLVDDHLMQTSLVLRAQEWYPSIAKHQVMFSDFWGKDQIPKYLHLPLILGETGNKKLSKRDGNVNMAGYLDQGFLPESIVNYLAFLGWSPGTDKELYLSQEDVQKFPQPIRVTRIIENIAKDFSIQTISKSPARFGSKKLIWFNREYIKMLSLDQFIELCRQYLIDLKMTNTNTKELDRAETSAGILENIQLKVELSELADSNKKLDEKTRLAFLLDKNRIDTLSQIGTESQCILNWQKPDKEVLKWHKSELGQSLENLNQIKELIQEKFLDIKSNEIDLVEAFLSKSKQWEDLIKKVVRKK
ncbi:hypothetical protein HC864_02520 [Candidatus Gracilibacteria bacterium]|nr:hypothetical protein [Candidatus Gracilibacteria bacterium]